MYRIIDAKTIQLKVIGTRKIGFLTKTLNESINKCQPSATLLKNAIHRSPAGFAPGPKSQEATATGYLYYISQICKEKERSKYCRIMAMEKANE